MEPKRAPFNASMRQSTDWNDILTPNHMVWMGDNDEYNVKQKAYRALSQWLSGRSSR